MSARLAQVAGYASGLTFGRRRLKAGVRDNFLGPTRSRWQRRWSGCAGNNQTKRAGRRGADPSARSERASGVHRNNQMEAS